MNNRIVNLLSITILLSLLLAPVFSAGVRGSGYAQTPDQPRATVPNAALAQPHTGEGSEVAAIPHTDLSGPGGPATLSQPVKPDQAPSDVAGRLASQSDGTWRSYTNGNYVNDLAVEGDTVWAATSGGVVRWNRTDGSYVKYTTADGLADSGVPAIAIDEAGHKWFGTGDGVSRFDGTTWTTYTTAHGLAHNSVRAIAIDEAGHKWLGTRGGVSRFDGTTWTTYRTADGLADNRVHAIAIDHTGHKWFGTWGGVSRFDGSSWTTYTTNDGLADTYIYAIAID